MSISLNVNGHASRGRRRSRTRRCSGSCATTSASPAPNTAAASRSAAPAPCTSTASRCARASRRSQRSPARKVTTIEGCRRRVAKAVQKAWVDARRAAVRLLPVGPDHVGGRAAREEAAADRRRHRRAMAGNICRCATYQRIRAAIHAAAKRRLRTQPCIALSACTRSPPRSRARPPPSASRCGMRRRAASCSVRLAAAGSLAARRSRGGRRALAPNAFVRIGADNTRHRRLQAHRDGPGQARPAWRRSSPRSSTPTGRRCASSTRRPTRTRYNNLAFGDAGHRRLHGDGELAASRCRHAGATARAMLVAAAAEAWKVPAAEITVDEGRARARRRAGARRFGELARGRGPRSRRRRRRR